MRKPSQPELHVGLSFLEWFQDQARHFGLVTAVSRACSVLGQFLRESMPDRRRQRYGDVDYDWEHRVDTTSATVGWRERLLGLLHSPYQPTDPALFHEMLATLDIDFREFVFIDIGSGKGRALLLAADYPFRKIIGVELLDELHRIALDNIRKYKSTFRQCFAIDAICGDATQFQFPSEPLVIYLFNPLPEAGMARLVSNLEGSLREKARPVFLLYHNALLEHVIEAHEEFRRIGGTGQYSVYGSNISAKKNGYN